MFSAEKRTFLNTFQYWEGRKRLLMNVVSLFTGMLGIAIMHYSCFPVNSFVLPFQNETNNISTKNVAGFKNLPRFSCSEPFFFIP